MKKTCIYLILLIVQFTILGHAFEGDIGRNSKEMALGFTSTPYSSFLSNPASVGEKILIEYTSSELFNSGVFYDSITAELSFNDFVRLGIGMEKVQDRDALDNSGYGQQLTTFGVAWKSPQKFQLGLNVRQESFELLEQKIGKGLAFDLACYAGPWVFKGNDIYLGVIASDINATRVYGERIEIHPIKPSINFNIFNNNVMYSLMLKQDEVRMGLEYKPVKGFTIRGGLHNGQPTCGFGFEKGYFQMDFAYWMAQAGGFYRISTSFSL